MENVNKFSDYSRVFDVKMNDLINTVMKIKDVQDSLIEINQNEQLQKGIDSKGQRIETLIATKQNNGTPYARYTVKKRTEKGLQVKNVDLKDTGDTYESFDVKVNNDSSEIIANFEKLDGNIMENFDTKYEFLGLTKQNLEGFTTWVFLDYLNLELRKQLGL